MKDTTKWDALSNWGRWGEGDELGTLNLITDEKRALAASLVRSGRAISCSLTTDTQSHAGEDTPYQRFMRLTGEGLRDPHRVPRRTRQLENGLDKHSGAGEYIGVNYHGLYVTHLDALSHVAWDGELYNGRPAELVNSFSGATVLSTSVMRNGIVSRGILYDVPRHRGVPWVEPGEAIGIAEVEAIEQETGVIATSGDIVILRTGTDVRRRDHGIKRDRVSGWSADFLPWFKDRGIALIASDSANDAVPNQSDLGVPLHSIAIPFMGLPLLDNCDLEELSQACAGDTRYEFMFVVSPLQLEGMTGSPVNPIAIL